MKPVQPWRKPLKERQAFAARQEAWQPKSVSQSAWREAVHSTARSDKPDLNDVSRDTKFDLDPEGHPLGGDEMDDREESKMTLQVHK